MSSLFWLIILLITLSNSQFLKLVPISHSFMTNWPNDITNCDNVTECFNKSMALRERYPYVTYHLQNENFGQNHKINSKLWCNISKNDHTFENKEEMVIFWLIKHSIILKLQKCNGFAQCLKFGSRTMGNHNQVYLTFGITGMGYYNNLIDSFESPYWIFYVSSNDKNNMLQTIEYREKYPKCYD